MVGLLGRCAELEQLVESIKSHVRNDHAGLLEHCHDDMAALRDILQTQVLINKHIGVIVTHSANAFYVYPSFWTFLRKVECLCILCETFGRHCSHYSQHVLVDRFSTKVQEGLHVLDVPESAVEKKKTKSHHQCSPRVRIGAATTSSSDLVPMPSSTLAAASTSAVQVKPGVGAAPIPIVQSGGI
jgi:hypothetical protein